MAFKSGSTLLKGAVLTVVALLLLVPLGLLANLVAERASLRERAVQTVAQGWGGRQLVGGPVLAIPVTRADDMDRSYTVDWYVLPEELRVNADVRVLEERRKLGVYEVPVYVATLRASGHFDLVDEVARLTGDAKVKQVHLDRARVRLPLGDPRGLRSIEVTGEALTAARMEPVRGFPMQALGAPLVAGAALAQAPREFNLTLEIAGTESFALLPLARTVTADVSGNWQHPGFSQGFLPIDRKLDGERFEAQWRILDLNRSYGGSWYENALALSDLQASAFGVELVQPVDLYQRALRAVKYGGLFIALSMLTLFLWENLARRRLHPIQYGLMGLALSVFYLLLLALAEHIGFQLAYAVAALALCALLGVYISGAFRSTNSGTAAAGVFAGVYALLYLLVTSEDYALLAGAIALFALLATLMVVTRKLDWYGESETAQG